MMKEIRGTNMICILPVFFLLALTALKEVHGDASSADLISARLQTALSEAEARQLLPSQFSLAATRFIVMLPFLPLLFAVPGATAIAMPLVMAMQDRLKTIMPNMPGIFPRPNTSGGVVSNGFPTTTAEPPTRFLFKRSLDDEVPVEKSKSIPPKASEFMWNAAHNAFKFGMGALFERDEDVEQLMSDEPDCRRQSVCRINQSVNRRVGSRLSYMMDTLRLENKLDKLGLSSLTTSILKDALKATRVGLSGQDCIKIYSKCSIPLPPK